MYLTKLIAKNFRSLRDVEWTPGKLNVVIGPNASGKSNLVSLIEMFNVSCRGGLRDFILEQGGMHLVVWDGQSDTVTAEIQIAATPGSADQVSYFCLELQQIAGLSDFTVNKEEAGVVAAKGEMHAKSPSYALVADSEKSESILNGLNVDRQAHPVSETILSSVGPNIFSDDSDDILAPVHDLKLALFELRVFRNFETHPKAPVRQSTVTRYQKSLDANGKNLVAFLHTLYSEDKDFKEDFDSAMRAAFGDEFEELVFAPASDNNILLRVRWKGQKDSRSTWDLSEGTLRFMFLIGILADPSISGMTVIEEPETGLHPSMFGIIAEFAAAASERAQIVFTTHSTDFLNALHEHKPTVTVTKSENGETKLNVISGKELDHWLKVYRLGDFHLTGAAESIS